MDGDSTKIGAPADVESTVVTMTVDRVIASTASVIDPKVAAVPAQPISNVVRLSDNRGRWVRSFAASIVVCLALSMGFVLAHSNALAVLASVGREASAR